MGLFLSINPACGELTSLGRTQLAPTPSWIQGVVCSVQYELYYPLHNAAIEGRSSKQSRCISRTHSVCNLIVFIFSSKPRVLPQHIIVKDTQVLISECSSSLRFTWVTMKSDPHRWLVIQPRDQAYQYNCFSSSLDNNYYATSSTLGQIDRAEEPRLVICVLQKGTSDRICRCAGVVGRAIGLPLSNWSNHVVVTFGNALFPNSASPHPVTSRAVRKEGSIPACSKQLQCRETNKLHYKLDI